MSQPMGDRTACWGWDRRTQSRGAPSCSVDRDRDGRPGDNQDISIPQGQGGTGRSGRGGAGRGHPGGRSWGQDSPGTCVSGGRQRIVPHPARYSSPCLVRAGPQPLRPHGPCVPSTPRPSHGDRGDLRGWVTQRWGHGHSLFNLLRTLLAIFLISVVSCSRSSLVSAG